MKKLLATLFSPFAKRPSRSVENDIFPAVAGDLPDSYLPPRKWKTVVQPVVDLKVAKIRGQVDRCAATGIHGWACYTEHPDRPVDVDIFFDDTLAGKTVADRLRQDLQKAGIGTGQHGFSFQPDADAFEHARTIEVRAATGQLIRKIDIT